MKENHFSFVSGVDGLTIDCLSVEPDSEARAALVMAHGIMEYKERYLPIMRFLAENGIACFMNDHRGYGKSVKSPDDNGYTYGAGAKGTVEDFGSLVKYAQQRYGGRKLFIYGHSMGSLVAVNYLKAHENTVDGVILSGLPEKNAAAGAGMKYLKLKKLVKGDRFRDESVNKLMFSSYASKFKGESSPFAWINSDPERVREYADDPLCGRLGTIDGYISLLDLLMGAYDASSFRVNKNLMPLFIFTGEDDPCAGNAEGAKKSGAYFVKLGYAKTKVKTFPGMRHEIHNEKEKEKVYAAVLNAVKDAL